MSIYTKRVASYMYTSLTDNRISLLTFIAMLVPTIAYSIIIDSNFLLRFAIIISMGVGVEFIYHILNSGEFKAPRIGTAISTGLLALSIPVNIPYIYVFSGVIVTLLLIKLPDTTYSGITFNPMLVGRLFIFMCCGEMIMDWTPAGDLDGLTAATPLALFAEEGATVPIMSFITGTFNTNWEDMYLIVPSSPGEILPVLTLFTGAILVFLKVIDWRLPIAFLCSTAVWFIATGTPVIFGLLSGGIIFSAVFIATCPTTTPIEPKARIIAGVLVGIINCAIRDMTYYPEGIMYSFLIINILSPTIDRIVFSYKSRKI